MKDCNECSYPDSAVLEHCMEYRTVETEVKTATCPTCHGYGKSEACPECGKKQSTGSGN